MLERVHRGRKSQHSTGPRNIYAKFYSWKDSELLKQLFMDLGKTHPKLKIRCEQMYSPDLTKRRNLALIERKTLIKNKKITFPAKLMVKKMKTDKKYIEHSSF